jgi:Zn-dependent M16 (insulinase) family peptidase
LALVAGCAHPGAGLALTGQAGMNYEQLAEDALVSGFRAQAVYVDGQDVGQGARFVHEHTGFSLVTLTAETVPQALVWVNTVPVSNRGEPHTQEHLLLGKGNKGRAVATQEDFSLAGSSAYTEQTRTVYQFNTVAGAEVFFQELEGRLDAMLHPDYTDEEIRREVHHYGVVEDSDGSGLRLEEKGTIYNEMASSMMRPSGPLWRAMGVELYGAEHPLAFSAGGLPAAIRTMEPEHIRAFHEANYHLGNMGMVAFFPPSVGLEARLSELDGLLRRLQPEPSDPAVAFRTEADLELAGPAVPRRTDVTHPVDDPAASGSVVLAWPASLQLTPADLEWGDMLFSVVAGRENTNLYKRLVDSRTRVAETGATSVWGSVSDQLGSPRYIGIEGIPGTELDDERVDLLAATVRAELAAVAALQPGDPALEELNRRAASTLVSWKRRLRKFVSSPPRFGYRGTYSHWLDSLDRVDEVGGYRRSLTFAPLMAALEARLDEGGNPWREVIATLALEEEPLVFINRPSPEHLASLESERVERLSDRLTALVEETAAGGESEALEAFRADYDAATAALAAAEEAAPEPRLVDAPPMTQDDSLVFEERPLGEMPWVVTHFGAMSGAMVQVAFDLHGVAPEHELLLPLLPSLIRRTGTVGSDGVVVPYDTMVERIQNEILSLEVYFSGNPITGRRELVVGASGSDAGEAKAALDWMAAVLTGPDWREENLPRLRDLVDERLSGLRRRTSGAEENWVRDPANAHRHQHDRLYLLTRSVFTMQHAAHRLRWMLMEPEDAAPLRALADRVEGLPLGELEALLGELAGQEPSIVGTAVEDLLKLLAGVPDDTAAADMANLLRTMAADLERPPAEVLASLSALREGLLRTGSARWVTASSQATEAAIAPHMEAWASAVLVEGAPKRVAREATREIDARVVRRGGSARAHFVGLHFERLASGVVINSAKGPGYGADADGVLDYLTAQTFSGGGAHGTFMRTWGAGLAYSNGVRPSIQQGTVNYYAERCPEIGLTVGFVVDLLKNGTVDEAIGRYALVQAFYSRAANTYESRATSMAADLVDGVTPGVVAQFRQAVLDAGERPDLVAQLQQRKERVYGAVFPGYGPPSSEVDGSFFVIGSHRQLDAWEIHLRSVENDENTDLQRLFPRDYWILAETYGR